jgi:hypothetical protein
MPIRAKAGLIQREALPSIRNLFTRAARKGQELKNDFRVGTSSPAHSAPPVLR